MSTGSVRAKSAKVKSTDTNEMPEEREKAERDAKNARFSAFVEAYVPHLDAVALNAAIDLLPTDDDLFNFRTSVVRLASVTMTPREREEETSNILRMTLNIVASIMSARETALEVQIAAMGDAIEAGAFGAVAS